MKRSLIVAIALLTACCVTVGFAPPEQAVRTIMNCFGNRIKNVGAPIDGTDAVNRNHSSNASNLTSGTVPDARFPSALPAVDGSALTAIQRSYSATSSSLASGASLTVTHAADVNLYRMPTFIGDGFAGDNTVLILQGDGSDGSTTFTDQSFYNRTVTANGNVQVDTAQSKFGSSSTLFDGSGDYLSVAASADFDFGTGAFTIAAWVRFASVATTQDLLSHYHLSGTASGWAIRRMSDNTVRIIRANDIVTNIAWTPLANRWYHVEVCKTGTSVYVFIDGTQIGSTISDAGNSWTAAGDTTLQVGRTHTLNSTDFNGWMESVLIMKGTALHTANFTPPASAYSTAAIKCVLPIVASGQTGIVVRYDDGAGANSSIKTTFTNNTGAQIRNATARVSLINTLAP